jgi:hypothetical protein
MNKSVTMSALLLVAGCQQQPQPANQAVVPAPEENAPAQSQPPAPTPPAVPTAPNGLPDDKTPLEEPSGPIDPKSAEAAGQVVQQYGALIEQGRWTASRQYWGDAAAAQAFERNFRTYADVHLEIGDLGEAEGAAGSIYVTEPVTFYGTKNGGGDYRRKAEVMLRRVNDVDGSTEAQRRWHIERIEWK